MIDGNIKLHRYIIITLKNNMEDMKFYYEFFELSELKKVLSIDRMKFWKGKNFVSMLKY